MPSSSPGSRITRHVVERMMRRELRRSFRRVVWVGEQPWETGALPADRPLGLYANHHSFHDGYLLWLLVSGVLGRPIALWMRDWDRAPLFGPLGALPFPTDDARRRLATVQETARRLRDERRTTFIYFPEGELGPPDAGLAPFDPTRFTRLARRIPDDVLWWPVGLRLTWWGEDRPTALLGCGAPHAVADGGERQRLAEVLERLRAARPEDMGGDDPGRRATVLLDGRASPHERWNLAPLAPLLRRWT